MNVLGNGYTPRSTPISKFRFSEEWLRDNFTVIMIVIIVLIALLIVKAVLKKKGIKLIKRKKKEGN